MARYGLKPEQMLMVDDLKTGYHMASAAGVPMAFAAWSRQECPKVLAAMSELCDFSFHSPEALMEYLFEDTMPENAV